MKSNHHLTDCTDCFLNASGLREFPKGLRDMQINKSFVYSFCRGVSRLFKRVGILVQSI